MRPFIFVETGRLSQSNFIGVAWSRQMFKIVKIGQKRYYCQPV